MINVDIDILVNLIILEGRNNFDIQETKLIGSSI